MGSSFAGHTMDMSGFQFGREFQELAQRVETLEKKSRRGRPDRQASLEEEAGRRGHAERDQLSFYWDPKMSGPIEYGRSDLTLSRTGEWRGRCYLKNHSRHSDWDIDRWFNLKGAETGSVIVWFNAWVQDLDAGEDWNKEGHGHAAQIASHWADLEQGRITLWRYSYRVRDN